MVHSTIVPPKMAQPTIGPPTMMQPAMLPPMISHPAMTQLTMEQSTKLPTIAFFYGTSDGCTAWWCLQQSHLHWWNLKKHARSLVLVAAKIWSLVWIGNCWAWRLWGFEAAGSCWVAVCVAGSYLSACSLAASGWWCFQFRQHLVWLHYLVETCLGIILSGVVGSAVVWYGSIRLADCSAQQQLNKSFEYTPWDNVY